MQRVAALVTALVFAALLAVPAALVTTERGTRWLARSAGEALPLRLDDVSGSVATELRIGALTYLGDGFGLRADGLNIRLDLRCLLRGVLCVSSLGAEQLSLTTFPGDTPVQSASPWEQLEALPSIVVGDASVDRFRWEAQGSVEELRALSLRGALGGGALDILRLAACHARACLDASGGIDARGRWRVEGGLDLSEGLVDVDGLAPPDALRFRADGDLTVAELTVSDASQDMLLSGELRYADADSASGRFRFEGLTRLLPGLAEQDLYQPAGPLDLVLTRRLGEPFPAIEVSQGLRSSDGTVLSLAARLSTDGDSLTVDALTLGRPEHPQLSGRGVVALASGSKSRMSVELASWRVPGALGLPDAEASGSLVLELVADKALSSWNVSAAQLELSEGDRLWQVDGQLRAAEDGVYPVGEATLTLRSPAVSGERPVSLRYARATAPGPARVSSTDSIESFGLAITSLGAELRPGDPLAFDLSASGDVTTDLSGTLAVLDSGVSLRVAPFDVAWQEEQFVLREGLGLDWDRSSRAFALQPVCLAWHSSEACSEGASVSADGELVVNLVVDEALRGEWQDAPYALAARGGGRALLRWRDWTPQAGRLEFAFDDLSLDPFAGVATAPPLRWERATLVGDWDGNRASLQAQLSSRQFGTLAIEAAVLDGQLDGTLRSSDLSLAALTDLAPEWRVESGAINGQLSLSGPVTDPALEGSLALREGRLRIPELDLLLDSLAVDARFAGRTLDLRGRARAGGGDLRLEASCCENEQLVGLLIGDRNRLQLENGLDAILSPSLDLRLSADQLTAVGSLTVHSGVFEHSGLEEGGVALSPDVRRLDVSAEAPARFGLNLDLRTLIEPGFTLRSERIEATLAGDLRLLLADQRPPSLFGSLEVRGGELRAYGQVLRLTDGGLGFVGDPLNPDLAISAEREIRADNQRVGFRVRGTLEEPSFELFSDPPRPDNETLSYLIRGRGPDVGVSADGTAMALSLGASAVNRSGVLAPLNQLPGLSGITLGAEGSDEDMAATISAYVGNRLYLSYGVGIYEPINALTARLYLRSRLWLEVVSRLENSFDLYYRFDLD